jgi:hypothetical protein
MICAKGKRTDRHGTTLVELVVAVAIMAMVFVAVMPVFAGIRNSADTRWANLEMVQNARVLNEQLCRSLAGARRIVAAGASTSDAGYIEFEAADGTVYRCALGAGGYIEFGPVGDPGELVGPVESLRFACYSGSDLTLPMSDASGARLVTWTARLRSPDNPAAAKTVTGACHVRTVACETPPLEPGTPDAGSQNQWRGNYQSSIIHHQ